MKILSIIALIIICAVPMFILCKALIKIASKKPDYGEYKK